MLAVVPLPLSFRAPTLALIFSLVISVSTTLSNSSVRMSLMSAKISDTSLPSMLNDGAPPSPWL